MDKVQDQVHNHKCQVKDKVDLVKLNQECQVAELEDQDHNHKCQEWDQVQVLEELETT